MTSGAVRARARRRQTYERGLRAEWVAAWWLRCHGYRVLARRLRTPAGEIDLVIRRGHTLAIVEVKRRETEEAALYAVSPRQQRRLARAARFALARFAGRSGTGPLPDLRFDLVTIRPWRLPRHYPDAWRPAPDGAI